jgi:hypothetical protein
MTDDLNQKRFTMKTVFRFIPTSGVSIAKPLLIAAPFAIATIFFVTGTHAQTKKIDAQVGAAAGMGEIAPIPAPEAAQTGRPKEKVKTPTNGRVANPSPANEPAVATPIAPIATPYAARTGRPKVRDNTPMDTSRVANAASTTTPISSIPVPEAARTGKPKVRVKTPMDTSRTVAPETTTAPIAAPEAARTGRPKEKVKEAMGRVANPISTAAPIAPIVVPDATRTGRPRERDDSPHN